MHDVSYTETQRLVTQQRLDARFSSVERNKSGQFATPPLLAEQITRYATALCEQRHGNRPIRFLEPSLGTGVFYSALQHIAKRAKIESAVGIELDHETAQAAEHLWASFGLHVQEGDFTTLDIAAEFNLILANPPYVRHHHLPSEQKESLRERVRSLLGYSVNGLAGLYCYFVLLADRCLAPGGIGAWLIPSEFMDVNYGEVLRRYLTEHVTLLRIHRFGPADVQFEDALVSSAVIVYEKRPPDPDHRVEFSLGGSLEKPEQRQSVEIAYVRSSRKWSPFPAAKVSLAKNRNKLPCIEDAFAIKRGIATGANDFFVLRKEEAELQGLPAQHLRPILPSPRYLTDRIIEADADGFPKISPRHVLIDCFLSPEEVRSEFPTLWRYFEKGRAAGLDQRYLTSRRMPWYRQEQREVAPFLCTYMGRNQNGRQPFRFFWNQSQATAPNVYLLMYPIGEFASKLRGDPSLYGTVHALLNALDIDTLLYEGRVYGGALHKIEPSELGRVPLIGFDDLIHPVKQMVLF